jgi:hypothetical protein
MAERIVRSNHEGCRRPLLSGLENNVFTIDATNEARAVQGNRFRLTGAQRH